MDRTRGLWADLGSNPRGLEAYFRQIQLKHGVWSPVLGQIPLDHWVYRGRRGSMGRALDFGSRGPEFKSHPGPVIPLGKV